MTYLKKKLLHKLLAFPYLKLCSFLLHLLSDVLFSLIPGLFDLGKLHRICCLQSLLVILHFATSCIISNSMIKNLNSDSSVSHTQMLQWMDSSTSALRLFSCYLPLYFPIVFLHHLLLSQILRHYCDETNPRLQITVLPLGSRLFFLIKYFVSLSSIQSVFA